LVLGSLLVSSSERAHARPTYFDAFTSLYSIVPDSNLDACGVCHFKWNGTGQRNPYGSTVEQHLYLGKSITQSLIDSELTDSDSDGFSNGDEITIHETLPAYSCDNYFLASGNPPVDYHTYCEPFVATCLVPIDIRLSTNLVGSFGVEVGETEIYSVEVFNNGSTFPVNVSSSAFQVGASPDYSLVGPTGCECYPRYRFLADHRWSAHRDFRNRLRRPRRAERVCVGFLRRVRQSDCSRRRALHLLPGDLQAVREV
jgi:hypothetical protein